MPSRSSQPEPDPAVPARQSEPAPARRPAELRIAVAMRGGVSLAVWMGGACSEIVRLRNAAPGRDDPYSKLLEILGYDKVTVDVISGSSAGGLNGALLALHLAYGMPFGDGVRDLWLQLGDLEQLTRSPSAPHPDSLLTGDEHTGFYGRLRDACHKLLDRAGDTRREREIRLVLTATRLDARTVRVPQTLGEPLHAGQARAYFRFQHRAVDGTEPIVTDFPAGAAHEVAERLAYAARTTSSFPGAFAPARIWVADGDPPPPGRDFRGTSSETGAGDEGGATAELIDGGVLDNIPVAWAIRAIAGAPADRPVDRWLVYLQPVEPHRAEPPAVPPKERRVTRLVRLLLATVSRRMDSESLLDDSAELHAAEATARHLRGVAAAGIPSDPSGVLADPRRLAAYRRLVGLSEGARLARLTEDPTSVVGPDPLPVPPDRPTVDPRVLTGLRDAATVADLACGDRVPEGVRTPFGLARTVSLLLDWVRAAETYRQLPPEAAAPLRDQLFSARLAIELLVGLRDRMVLRHLDGAGTAAEVVDVVRRATWRLVEAVGPGWRIPTPDTWPAWRDHVRAVAAGPLPDDVPQGWPDEVFAPFWDQLAAVGVGIGSALDPGTPGPPGFDALRTAAAGAGTVAGAGVTDGAGVAAGSEPPAPRSSPEEPAALGGATPLPAGVLPPAQVETMRRALAAAELLLGPVRTDPFTEPTDVRFHAITASRANPVEQLVFGRELRPGERNDLKLSGNQLSNFAAFLSARWRHTDWTWGRLDAVPSLVRLLLADESRLARRTDEELMTGLEALYRGGADGQTDAGWAAHRIDAGNVRERFADVVVERLQHGVLAGELPVLEKLHSRGGDSDLPPRPDDLTGLPPADLSKAPLIAEVGREQLHGLLDRWHTRRTATRVGLVGWRAVQPAGTGVFARLGRMAFGLVKPLLLLPALAAVASPLGAIVAALGAWLLVAAVAGTWSSPVIQPLLAAGFALAGGIAAWRLAGAKGWTIAIWAVLGAALVVGGGPALVGFGMNGVWDQPVLRYGAMILGALAAVVPFWWLLVSRAAGARVLGLMLLLLLVAGVAGIVLSTVPDAVPGSSSVGWLSGPALGLVTLYAVLTIPTALLTWLFPAPPGRSGG